MVENCGDCRFWFERRMDEYSGMADCRRYPPPMQDGHSRGGVVAKWNKTSRHDWCGEFSAKAQEKQG